MRDHSSNSSNFTPSPPPFPGASTSGGIEELARVFNTALVASRAGEPRDFPGELYRLMESPAFRAILNAVRQHARLQGLTEKQAAEQVIEAFRKVDELWGSYIFQEGVARIGNSGS